MLQLKVRRVTIGAMRVVAWLLVAAALLALLGANGACGADGVDASPPEEEILECKRADDYLTGMYELVDAGELDNLRDLLSEGLSGDLQGELVTTIIKLLGAFEPGTFVALGAVSDVVDSTADLQSLLADLVRWLAETGPGAPYPDAMGAVRALLNTCEGPPVLGLLRDLLRDEALLRAVLSLLTELDLGSLTSGIEFEGETGGPAIKALIRNILVAATDPSFDVEVIIDLLGLILDLEEPPWDTVVEGVRRLLGPGESLDAIQGLLVCLREVDPELHLIDLLLDLLTDESLDLGSALGGLTDLADPASDAPLIPPSLAGPLDQILAFLIQDAPARCALVEVLTVALLEQNVAPVLGDLATLLEAQVIGDIVNLLVTLASRSCDAP